MSGLLASMVVAAFAAAPQVLENNVEIHDLPAIAGEMTVGTLLTMEPFKDAAKKIELRVLYVDGTSVKSADPKTATAPGGGSFSSWIVERYGPGFVKETTTVPSPSTKFDGEDRKKTMRTTAIPSGGGLTFKDKGGAVAVIVKKPMTGSMLPMSIDPTVKLVIYTAAGLAAGILLGWLMFGRKGRA
jgi:hypothetical protein